MSTVDSDSRYAYAFDDIGNRKTSAERGANSVYAANQLNQYTAVADGLTTNLPTSQLPNLPTFTPAYDADGNQTLVKTATGVWSVTYNGENRPVRWVNGNTVITMSYDRMGRRVTKNNQRFVYDGYLQIADNAGNTYIWDPTEKIATRPLAWNSSTPQPSTSQLLFYTHDGNKNVSEVIASNNDVAAHYEYAPFGALTVSRGTSAAANPWRFSSEYADDEVGCDYYNYREYEPVTGRWLQRDPIEELGAVGLYSYCKNSRLFFYDIAGLDIYIESTAAANGMHERICVDTWVVTDGDDYECCAEGKKFKKSGKYCISFGWDSWFSRLLGSSSSSKREKGKTPKDPSPYDGRLPSGMNLSDEGGNGSVYDDNKDKSTGRVDSSDKHLGLDSNKILINEILNNEGIVDYGIRTCATDECYCDFDMDILKYFKNLVGKRGRYEIEDGNCRNFSRELDIFIQELFNEYKRTLEGE